MEGVTHQIRSDVVRMFKVGNVPPERIADELGLPKVSVIAILIQGGVTRTQIYGEPAMRGEGPEVRRYVTEAYVARIPVTVILRRFSLTREDFWRIINESGVPLRKIVSLKELAKLRRDMEVVALYKDGITVYAIWDLTGVVSDTMYGILAKYGVPLRHGRAQPSTRQKRQEVVDHEVDVQGLWEEAEQKWREAVGEARTEVAREDGSLGGEV